MKEKMKVMTILLCTASLLFTGCGGNDPLDMSEMKSSEISEDSERAKKAGQGKNAESTENADHSMNENNTDLTKPDTKPADHGELLATDASGEIPIELHEVDWSDYFHGLTGSAVLYVPAQQKVMVYNEELSNIQRSPCSTFKIISSLIGIENGVIKADDSMRTWSGEKFWNEKWNRDIDFKDAFQSSCIWYFREVIDEAGKEFVQAQLDSLKYGNCDISDWEGYLNNNNNNRALTGFWVESSLKISPKEQTEVMERIFGEESVFRQETQELLKDAMLVTDTDTSDLTVYGKTGMGKLSGVVVDAWFTGFFDKGSERAYFCVYIGQSDHMDVSSSEAKKIAIQMIRDYADGQS